MLFDCKDFLKLWIFRFKSKGHWWNKSHSSKLFSEECNLFCECKCNRILLKFYCTLWFVIFFITPILLFWLNLFWVMTKPEKNWQSWLKGHKLCFFFFKEKKYANFVQLKYLADIDYYCIYKDVQIIVLASLNIYSRT